MPQLTLDPTAAVDSLVRLRRLERAADEDVRGEIGRVAKYLEDAIGPTVSRAEAARLLGVSHTALARWIEKGEISAVATPGGRYEVPLAHLVELLDAVGRSREAGRSPALASVIRDRRARAEEIAADDLLPRRRRRPRTHRVADLQALAYHRAVARRLDVQLVREARQRLQRWREAGRIHPRWADAWDEILDMPLSGIAKTISADNERSRELRQSSPFAGVLTEQERRRLLEVVDEYART